MPLARCCVVCFFWLVSGQRSSLRAHVLGFRGISSLPALPPVFHGPCTSALPLSIDLLPLGKKLVEREREPNDKRPPVDRRVVHNLSSDRNAEEPHGWVRPWCSVRRANALRVFERFVLQLTLTAPISVKKWMLLTWHAIESMVVVPVGCHAISTTIMTIVANVINPATT